jgi:hypothetical protein
MHLTDWKRTRGHYRFDDCSRTGVAGVAYVPKVERGAMGIIVATAYDPIRGN